LIHISYFTLSKTLSKKIENCLMIKIDISLKDKIINLNMPNPPSASTRTPLIAIYKEKPDLRKTEPPLIDLKVTNPLTYLKSWWKRVISNEGIDFRFRIHPLTAIALTVIVATFGFGVGRFSLISEKPYIKYTPVQPTPTAEIFRQTAFSGTLQLTNLKYYLITNSSEAINMEVPKDVDLKPLVGRRIFATGQYSDRSNLLIVGQATDLEILPKKIEAVPLIKNETISASTSAKPN